MQKGFTLVELLVVISIIAILSIIGLTIYTGVQKNARDTKRKADIDAIAKVMEVNFNNITPCGDVQTGTCTGGCSRQYCGLRHCMFINAIPSDPINSGTSCSGNECKYCVRTSAGSFGNCRPSPNDPKVDSDSPACGVSYIICANLETNSGVNNQNYYCRSNQL